MRWAHEVERPHPVLFFDEAALTHKQYETFLKQYPEAEPALRRAAVFRKKTVGIDLLELQWNPRDTVSESALRELRRFDVQKLPLERYEEVALEKWEHFAQAARKGETVFLLDSAVFQFQIFTFLLKNQPFDSLKGFVGRLFKILQPLSPALVYFYRADTEDAIRFLEERRGTRFLEGIWERDRNESYYRDRPRGAEGQRTFLRDYARIAEALFQQTDCRKLHVDITGQDWEYYENELLSFTGIGRRPYPRFPAPQGTYQNENLSFRLSINGLELTDPSGIKRLLTPKSEREFYVDCLPSILRLDGQEIITVTGGQISERWTATGTEFVRI